MVNPSARKRKKSNVMQSAKTVIAELVGGPFDGKKMDVSDTTRAINLPSSDKRRANYKRRVLETTHFDFDGWEDR